MDEGPSRVTNFYQTKNTVYMMSGSQTTRDKFRGQKGNSPDLQLRSQNRFKWRRMFGCRDNQDVGLEAATHLKSA